MSTDTRRPPHPLDLDLDLDADLFDWVDTFPLDLDDFAEHEAAAAGFEAQGRGAQVVANHIRIRAIEPLLNALPPKRKGRIAFYKERATLLGTGWETLRDRLRAASALAELRTEGLKPPLRVLARGMAAVPRACRAWRDHGDPDWRPKPNKKTPEERRAALIKRADTLASVAVKEGSATLLAVTSAFLNAAVTHSPSPTVLAAVQAAISAGRAWFVVTAATGALGEGVVVWAFDEEAAHDIVIKKAGATGLKVETLVAFLGGGAHADVEYLLRPRPERLPLLDEWLERVPDEEPDPDGEPEPEPKPFDEPEPADEPERAEQPESTAIGKNPPNSDLPLRRKTYGQHPLPPPMLLTGIKSEVDGRELMIPIGRSTGLPTSNPKLGESVLVSWVIDVEHPPREAMRLGLDVSTCDACPQRPYGIGGNENAERMGACYVQTTQNAISGPWKAARAALDGHDDSYQLVSVEEAAAALQGWTIRLPEWGEIAAVPFDTVEPILKVTHVIGYTHRWADPSMDPRWRDYLMASTETVTATLLAQRTGFRTYRMVDQGWPRLPSEAWCPFGQSAPHSGSVRPKRGKRTIQCQDCLWCDGLVQERRGYQGSVVTVVHGVREKRWKWEENWIEETVAWAVLQGVALSELTEELQALAQAGYNRELRRGGPRAADTAAKTRARLDMVIDALLKEEAIRDEVVAYYRRALKMGVWEPPESFEPESEAAPRENREPERVDVDHLLDDIMEPENNAVSEDCDHGNEVSEPVNVGDPLDDVLDNPPDPGPELSPLRQVEQAHLGMGHPYVATELHVPGLTPWQVAYWLGRVESAERGVVYDREGRRRPMWLPAVGPDGTGPGGVAGWDSLIGLRAEMRLFWEDH